MKAKLLRALPLALILSLLATTAFAQDGEIVTNNELAYAVDNIFLLVAAVLVIFMQAGFAMVESGFNSAKNTVNIMFKNFVDLSAGVVLFWLVGYSIMYGAPVIAGFLGWSGFGIGTVPPEALPGNLNPQVDWLFQAAFAATAATIVSGAVAGRMKFSGYLVYSMVITALIYPISGYWVWGGGWLAEMGFHDFAGSLVVHAVGGFAALAAVIVLGPRIGRFGEGKTNPFPPHSISLATLGVFILWVGWYGFNPGSQLAFTGALNTDATMMIAVNTTLAAAAGTLLAMTVGWIRVKKPDIGYTLNGALAGLVAITAGADAVTNSEALLIGAIGGMLVVLGMEVLEMWKIDDTVGAWPVHGFVGMWGGIAVGIFGEYALTTQIIGSLAIPAWAFTTSLVLFLILKGLGILRVSPEDEAAGLDLSEHGTGAYSIPGMGVAGDD